MFLTRSEYDRGVNTFSPEGRLFQVEYAIEAIRLGSTALGITSPEGVVLAVERRLASPLLEPNSVEKLFEIDSHIGCAMSGILADARTLVDHARAEAQSHSFTFDEPMPIESVASSICDTAINFGEGDGSGRKPMARPYGVALLLAGVDKNGPALFQTDPSGTLLKFKAQAIGSAYENANQTLQEQWHSTMSMDEITLLSLRILKEVMEDKINNVNVEVGVVLHADKKFRKLSEQEVQGYLDRLQN